MHELLEHPADVNAVVKVGCSSLMLASQQGHTDIVRVLLEHQADVNAVATDGCSSLMATSDQGQIDIVRVLLEYQADVNAATEDGLSSLMLASRQGRIDTVCVLLAHLADVNVIDKTGHSSLLLASLRGHIDIVHVLLEHRAIIPVLSLEQQGRLPRLALDCFAANSDRESKDISENDDEKASAATAADIAERKQKQQKKHKKKKDKKKRQKQKKKREKIATAGLFDSIRCGADAEVISQLIKGGGANVNARDEGNDDSATPLTLAVGYNQNDVARLLIQHRAGTAALSPKAVSSNLCQTVLRRRLVELREKESRKKTE